MYIIDQTYFNKQYTIPNINEMDSDNLTVLTQYIDEFGRLFMQNLLGFELFKAFDSYVVNGVLDNSSPQKWKDLINGKEYTDSNGVLQKWQGLAYTQGSLKKSVIVPFVYTEWLKDKASQMTGTGEKVVQAQNAVSVNPSQRIINTWNDFVSEYQGLTNQTKEGVFYYHNGVMVRDYRLNASKGFVSVVQFILDHPNDYPNVEVSYYKPINSFGL
ncbi:hypothetical protein [Flavobacterium covae]|uniref:hypothetical protein n=1 Tax=Flavobacterium covae TaxID=2906076 RepID=UPI000F517790|nr:hypothetical protein [Flavobacterium covae]